MHWHAYSWTGSGADRGKDAERTPGTPGFDISPLPPARTGDWLLKPAHRIALTCDDVKEAAQWMARQYQALEGSLLHPDRVGLDARLETVVDVLPRGVDVQWGEWLKGGRFATIGMICCPNRHVAHPCPMAR